MLFILRVPVLNPQGIQAKQIREGGGRRKQVFFLHVRIVHKQEETIAKQIVKVLDFCNLVLYEQGEIFKESAEKLHVLVLYPLLNLFVVFTPKIGVVQRRIHTHQSIAVVEVVVEVDQHFATGNLGRVFQLKCNEKRTKEGNEQRKCANRRFRAEVIPVYVYEFDNKQSADKQRQKEERYQSDD
jgi:hypothetical protein